MRKGFTLIELLVVISIIGLLAAAGLATYTSAQKRARDAKRKMDMRAMYSAVEAYYTAYNKYPSTGGSWWGVSDNGGNRATSGANAYIPGLVPDFITVLPTDLRGITSGWSGYLYRSDGTQFKLLSHSSGPESFPSAGEAFYDPVRPTWAWMLCSGGAVCTTW